MLLGDPPLKKTVLSALSELLQFPDEREPPSLPLTPYNSVSQEEINDLL